MQTLEQIDRLFDQIPRAVATATELGPFVVFGRCQGWPHYARPRIGGGTPTPADLQAVRARQRRLGVPEEVEWIDELAPELAGVCAAAGLAVQRHQLMVLDALQPVEPPQGYAIELVGDPLPVGQTRAAVRIGFGTPGTDVGAAGAAERDRELDLGDQAAAFATQLIDRHLMLMACARGPEGIMAGGSLVIRGDAAEIVGVATLPAARRRGLAAAVTGRLAQEANDRGIGLCVLSAETDAVAAIYARLGFRRVGTACTASSG